MSASEFALFLFAFFVSVLNQMEISAQTQTDDKPPLLVNYQPATLPNCPEGFLETPSLCFKFSNASSFLPKCPFPNIVPFHLYEDVLLNLSRPVWMPIQRRGHAMRWIEHSNNYLTVFNKPYFQENEVPNTSNLCLLYFNTSYIAAVSCEEDHPRVCAYKKRDLWDNPLCGDVTKCVQSSLSSESKCVCIGAPSLGHKAEFLEPYQNRVYGMLTDQNCTIGLEKMNNTWIWSTSKRELEYSYWSLPTNLSGNHVAITTSGWIPTEEALSCSLVEKDVNRIVPVLNLKPSYGLKLGLILNIFNIEGLLPNRSSSIFCFYNSSLSSYNQVVLPDFWSDSVEFAPILNLSSTYWCEGFSYLNSSLITSNSIAVDNTTFAVVFNQTLQNFFSDSNGYCTYDMNTIIKTNEEGDLKETYFYCLVPDYIETYSTVNHVKNLISGSIINLFSVGIISLRSFQYCFGSKETLSWPATRVKSMVYSEEYCFKPNGFRLSRECFKNAQDEAEWSPVNESCSLHTPSNSSLTQTLLLLDQKSASSYLLELSRRHQEFKPFDVFLTADLCLHSNDSRVFSQILNNVLKIDTQVLKESQLKMRATDIFVNTTSSLCGSAKEYQKYKNFACVPSTEKIQDVERRFKVISSKFELADSSLNKTFENVIFIAQANDTLFTLFFNDLLFQHNSSFGGHVGAVYGFRSFVSARLFFRFDTKRWNGRVKCGTWDQYANSSFWKVMGDPQFYHFYFVCNATGPGYHTLILTLDDNVTESLRSLSTRNGDYLEKLSELAWMLTKYSKFSATDLVLVGQILNETKSGNPFVDDLLDSLLTDNRTIIGLDVLVSIVTNFQKINLPEGSSQTILTPLKRSFENFMSSESLHRQSENFLVFSVQVNEMDFLGFVLRDKEFSLLDSSSNITNLVQTENFDIIAVFSPEQLSNQSQIIVYVYYTNTFFNDRKTNIDKVVDVHFSQALSNLSTPITVYHKARQNDHTQCVSWSYASSTWKNESGNSSSSLECKYWHNSPFALSVSENITQSLLELSGDNGQIMEKLVEISSNREEFTSVDVVLLSDVLKNLSDYRNNSLKNLSEVVSNLQEINRTVLEQSQLNGKGSDSILHYTDLTIKNHQSSHELVVTDNFVVFIRDLSKENFSGIAILNGRNVEVINSTIEELSNRDNVTSFVLLSSSLKEQLVQNDSKVIIMVYFKDVLFNEVNSTGAERNVSVIFDVILSLPVWAYRGPVMIFHRINRRNQGECAYWKYDVPNNIPGFWENNSTSQNLPTFVRCDFSHTTHFALLLLQENKYDNQILDTVTMVTIILSFISYLVMICIILFKKRFRKKVENKVLLQFLVSGFLLIFFFYLSDYIYKSKGGCLIIGSFLHYAVLAQSAWMAVIAIMQFRRFIKVIGTYNDHIILNISLPAWLVPVIFVVILLSINSDSYSKSKSDLCYPSGYGLHYFVWLPIGCILVFNIVVFIIIVYFMRKEKSSSLRRFGGNEAVYQRRQFVFLFFVLGLSWSFGFIAELHVVFATVFNCLATLQGFVILIFFFIQNYNHFSRYVYRVNNYGSY